MEYTFLGRTGMRVSRLCLGTMNFGVDTDEKTAFRIMDEALDSGINFFDTANIYGWGENAGLTESIIGKWFAQGGQRREKVVLATKVYEPISDPNDGPNDVRGLSLYKIRRHLEGSLKRLQTDHIELYQMHHIDRRTPWDEIWEAFESQVRSGKVDYIGSSNFAGWHLVKAQAAAEKRNFMGLVTEQHKYSLLERTAEMEVLPAARDLGLGVVAWSPLAGGLLGGRALKGAAGTRTSQRADLIEKHRAQLERFSALCKELGEKEAYVALAWVLANPALTAPIIGPRTVDQLRDTVRAVEIILDENVISELNDIFPGPGGETPEVYAW
ncbi:aldo/keto reductase [Bacillus sonorensis]|uniref:Oxidoreductase n=2 Tax=Bacillus sonorensis TaxID=119858 RepID=M5PGI9_9BACI|nr:MULTISPECIES: aldo/keto reductase [Bacillus]ASB89034.1 Aryl-alcohol dehydrogenase (NADP(+)) [Bacillus sonorensis]EME75742.1 oxidoreductase [Bacillus sonorensis L12]MBG9915004.1 oxidoreductase [Bacillus sonorensis]MCF7618384.1 aldo/keto reductase [Bacillus sonorensis]MCY7859361.1 aldo/keto reductase [Bacillus sonorensis]